jgi:UDP-N-acetylmuramyl pentapeptide phosphotransferase/UDP-N-acetylglucosamine-1-phosphate transferase
MLPFVGRVDPGSVELFDPPGIGAIDLGQVLTVFGIVAVANVINLIDGADGLAAGVCLISAAALAVIGLSLDRNAADDREELSPPRPPGQPARAPDRRGS